MLKKYFLAANSAKGFVSYFDSCFDPLDGWSAYIIKGGPGTGKSSFMKKTVAVAESKGIEAELYHCSSDPDSLDAVIFPTLKIVIMDGTAPHTVDPKYAGAVETILNFGQFWKTEGLIINRESIIKLTDINKQFHRNASLYLSTAGNLVEDNFNISHNAVNTEKLMNFTKKFIKGRGTGAKESVRFLGGISPKGVVAFPETLEQYEKIIIKDFLGGVSHKLMEIIRDKALGAEYEIITLKNPLLPYVTDHIIIPELNTAFVREYEDIEFVSDKRRIHPERFLDLQRVNSKKNKIKFNKKAYDSLIKNAVANLRYAKEMHDDLEKLYIDNMDYVALDEFTREFCNKILGTV